jgi:hypothetical protein
MLLGPLANQADIQIVVRYGARLIPGPKKYLRVLEMPKVLGVELRSELSPKNLDELVETLLPYYFIPVSKRITLGLTRAERRHSIYTGGSSMKRVLSRRRVE